MESVDLKSLAIHSFLFDLQAHNAKTNWYNRECLKLVLSDRDDHTGRGEISPLPGYSRHSLDECKQVLKKFQLDIQNQDKSSYKWESWIQTIQDFPAPVRCGLETAFIDLLSSKQNKPAWKFLRKIFNNLSNLDIKNCKPIEVSYLVQEKKFNVVQARIKHAFEQGFRTFKVKIGEQSRQNQEISLLSWLRLTWNDTITIRIDSNCSLTDNHAKKLEKILENFDIEFWEEPCDHYYLPAKIPLAQDESLQFDLVHPETKILVLKPMLLGLSACLKLAASHLDKKVVISHTFEGNIGWHGAASLALAIGNDNLACGLSPHTGLNADQLCYFQNNNLIYNDKPGIGI